MHPAREDSPVLLQDQITGVERTIATEGKAQVLGLAQTFDATAASVWQALTTPVGLAAWFEAAEGDLREGGDYRLPGSGVTGTVRTCREEELLELTWNLNDSRSTVSVEVTEVDAEHTRVRLIHRIPRTMHWQRFGAAAPGIGWDGAMAGLRGYVEGTLEQIKSELAGLNGSSAGRAHIDALAASWGEAEVAGGEKPATAQRRAKDCAKFYKALGKH